MKRLFLSTVLLLTAALTSNAVIAAPPLREGEQFDLALTGITWRPENPAAGDEILFTISYTNLGSAPVPDDATVEITLKVFTVATQDTPSQEVGTACAEKAPYASGLKPNDRSLHHFAACSFKPPLEGNYRIEAALAVQDASGAALADPAAGNTFQIEALKVGSYQTALPDQLAHLFAGLGMFMAVMAIMALGTEAVIDSGKVMLGLKSKVTALAALDEMEKVLPGQLASLGVGAASQQQIVKLTQDLRVTLKPVDNIRDAHAAIQKGEFAQAFKKIADLVPTKGQAVAQAKIAELKAAAREAVSGLDRLGTKLGLPAEFVAEAKDRLEEQISVVDLTRSGEMLEIVFGELHTYAQQLPDKWLENQRDLLLGKGRDEVLRLFDNNVKPELEGMGLKADTVGQARQKIQVALEAVDAKAMAATDTYITGLRNLLQGVEDRRNDLQSPIRKLWRRLRTARFGDWAVAVAVGLVVGLVYALRPGLPGDQSLTLFLSGLLPNVALWLIRLIVGLIAGVTTVVLGWILLLVLGRLGQAVCPPTNDIRLSEMTNLHKVEILWNVLRGDPEVDPEQFGTARTVEKTTGVQLSAATAAQAVMKLTDQQRDEEDSRLRWLRVLSVLVGLVLAYLLQVDAAQLLDAAVPGVGTSLNFFKIQGGDLHRVWQILPPELNLTPGILLTALAASAGSTFWHDQLDRLQAAKKGAETAARLVKQAKGETAGE